MRILDKPSPNFNRRPRGVPVDMVVLHYTGMKDFASALARLRDPDAEVSSHYLIDEDGSVYRLVDEKNRAWHAGKSQWRGFTDINARSIGIELVNPGLEFGYREFPAAQIDALCQLLADIMRRHAIQPRNVVGHSDIAPQRKQDPGALFPWPILAAKGLALAIPPDDAGILANSFAVQSDDDIIHLLSNCGYGADLASLPDFIRAFQLRYRPSRVDGVLDAETVQILRAVAGV